MQFNIRTIITACRLTKSKGLEDIIEISEKIIKNNIQVRYYILGDFSNLKSSYINKIKELNKHPNIYFEGFKNNLSFYFAKSHSQLPTIFWIVVYGNNVIFFYKLWNSIPVTFGYYNIFGYVNGYYCKANDL